jgi:DNA-binding NtrC family response regulator
LNEEKKSILIVEDDKAILKSLKDILQSEGYSVDTAETGREAIQKSKAKFFNLALLDIKLPDMEGTKLLTTLHQDLPKMMKIMITGYPSLENAVEALNQGADAYIIKPVKPEKLLALIEEKLREQSQAEKMTEEKVVDWIKTRARKIENESRKGNQDQER